MMDITLYRGFPVTNKFTSSPFVSKLELRLHVDRVKHIVAEGSAISAPRSKIPYVALSKRNDDGGNTEKTPATLGDSTLIIQKLMRDGVLGDLNAHLSPTQKAQDLALRGMLEDRLYWFHYYEMWMQNYYTMRSWILYTVPYPAQVILGLIIWRTVQANLAGQGTGRFSADEVRMFRREAWDSLEALLADGKSGASDKEPFWVLGGDRPTKADMSLFGTIVSVLAMPAVPEAKKLVESLPTVMDYAEHVRAAYFPEYSLGF